MTNKAKLTHAQHKTVKAMRRGAQLAWREGKNRYELGERYISPKTVQALIDAGAIKGFDFTDCKDVSYYLTEGYKLPKMSAAQRRIIELVSEPNTEIEAVYVRGIARVFIDNAKGRKAITPEMLNFLVENGIVRKYSRTNNTYRTHIKWQKL